MENITIANVVEVLVMLTGAVGIALAINGAFPNLTAIGARRWMELVTPNYRMAAAGIALAVHAHGVAADARAEGGAPLDPSSNIAVTTSAARALAHGHRQTTDPTSGITTEHGGTICI